VIRQHLENIYSYYGDVSGVRIARKHISWYFNHIGGLPESQKSAIFHAETPKQQLTLVNSAFNYIIPKAA
jgi:tRNA-dihydrouridine synthase B